MKPRWDLLAILAGVATVVSLAFALPQAMVSPGRLAPAHADLATDCFACHSPFRGAVADRCVACHAVKDIGVRTTKGAPLVRAFGRAPPRSPFHQKLTTGDCLSCHGEHAGAGLAARPGPTFSHALLQPDARAGCRDCHQPPADPFHRNLTANCSQCHTSRQWTPSTFDHSRWFALEGDHKVGCATCHAGGDFTRYSCFSCHEHRPAATFAEHREEGVRGNLNNCAACHRGADDEPRRGRDGGGEQDD
jgi:hypothetical protein